MAPERSSQAGARYPLDPLVDVLQALRGPGGCPWDRAQTHESLRPYVIEEAYEVAEAIDSGDGHKLREELGDLLLQVVFHAAIAAEAGRFDVGDVVAAIRRKLVHRHPHVFGTVSARTPADVERHWAALKAAEGRPGSPRAVPALVRAEQALTAAREAPPAVWVGRARAAVDRLAALAGEPGVDAVRRRRAVGEALWTLTGLALAAGVGAEGALHAVADSPPAAGEPEDEGGSA